MKKVQHTTGFSGLFAESALYLLLAAIVTLSLTACAVETAQNGKPAMVTAPGYHVTISPTPVDYRRKTVVVITGSGFKPKQQLGLRLVMGGVLSDISSSVKPPPVANEYGAFSSNWLLDGEIGAKLLTPTAYTIFVVDQDGNTLATAPLSFKPEEKKPAKKK
jgi:hypothetical protein